MPPDWQSLSGSRVGSWGTDCEKTSLFSPVEVALRAAGYRTASRRAFLPPGCRHAGMPACRHAGGGLPVETACSDKKEQVSDISHHPPLFSQSPLAKKLMLSLIF